MHGDAVVTHAACGVGYACNIPEPTAPSGRSSTSVELLYGADAPARHGGVHSQPRQRRVCTPATHRTG